jgi:hypothetical protein
MSVSTEKAFSLKSKKPIDDDELLTEEDRQPKAATQKAEDCSARRRACKNCVCGRAEVERKLEAEGKLLDDSAMPPGGCGNCSRGDAFRCATCPFNGKPAWNAEDGKVKLALTDDI